MTSSSILDNSSFPHYARLRNQNGRNCEWIPATSADHNSTWLQIDLGNVTNVSAVATQGSCSGDQWTKSYVIIYSKNGEDWKTYEDLGSTVSTQKIIWKNKIYLLMLLIILLGIHWQQRQQRCCNKLFQDSIRSTICQNFSQKLAQECCIENRVVYRQL